MHALRAAQKETNECGCGLRILRLRRVQIGRVRQATATYTYYTRILPKIIGTNKHSSSAEDLAGSRQSIKWPGISAYRRAENVCHFGSSANRLYHNEPITSPAVYAIHLESKMTEKITPKDNSANMQNANKGTSGTNKQYDQVQGNRSKQIGAVKSPAPTLKQPGKK